MACRCRIHRAVSVYHPGMIRLFRYATLLTVLGLAACHASAPSAPPDPGVDAVDRPRILVFTQTLGFRHESIPTAVATLRELAAELDLEVVHSEDPATFDAGTLAGFRVVVFANTTGNVLDAPQRAAFERYVRDGGGFVGVHSAADTGHDWPWYGELVGAWFQGHPPGLQTSDVRFEGGHAPEGAAGWRITDELYNYRHNPRPRVDVIATVDESQYEGGTMGNDHPIAWCHARFGGRAWYTGLGHDGAVYADPVYRAHLLRGLRYATGLATAC
jgi:uncharacterized protein